MPLGPDMYVPTASKPCRRRPVTVNGPEGGVSSGVPKRWSKAWLDATPWAINMMENATKLLITLPSPDFIGDNLLPLKLRRIETLGEASGSGSVTEIVLRLRDRGVNWVRQPVRQCSSRAGIVAEEMRLALVRRLENIVQLRRRMMVISWRATFPF
jgi:hypothetical protein